MADRNNSFSIGFNKGYFRFEEEELTHEERIREVLRIAIGKYPRLYDISCEEELFTCVICNEEAFGKKNEDDYAVVKSIYERLSDRYEEILSMIEKAEFKASSGEVLMWYEGMLCACEILMESLDDKKIMRKLKNIDYDEAEDRLEILASIFGEILSVLKFSEV